MPDRIKLPPGNLSRRNRAMVALCEWEVLPFHKLEDRFKLTIAHHLKGPLLEGKALERKVGRSSRVGIVTLPMPMLALQIMNDPDRRRDFKHFDEYHRYYARFERKRIKKIAESSEYASAALDIWPIVLRGTGSRADDQETIWDGWHRTHCYYSRGVEEVPAIWYVD